MGDSIFDTFQQRAAKFEEDLLVSFNETKKTLTTKFSNFLKVRGFVSKFQILSACVVNYLTVLKSYNSYNWFATLYVSATTKLSEVLAFENKLLASFQEKSVFLLMYPLIFQTSKNSLSILANATPKQVLTSSPKLKILTAISK